MHGWTDGLKDVKTVYPIPLTQFAGRGEGAGVKCETNYTVS